MSKVSSSNSQEVLVPKLRFPGFKENWQTSKLSDFTERVTRKNSNNESNLPLTISSKDGLVNQVSYFNKTVASKDMSGYYLLKNGEFAYNKSYSVGYDFGSIKRLDRYPMGTLSTLYICFALIKNDSDFMKIYFDSLKWYKEIYLIAAEGARNHGLLNVPTEEFFHTKHILPKSISEQRKIANFFMLIEKRIEKQQKLVDSLKLYKRGVIQRIFSNTEYSEPWSKIRIKDLFENVIDKNHPKEDVLTIIQGFGTTPRKSVDRRISYDSSSVSTYKKVKREDFIMHLRSFEGGLEIANQNGIVSPAYTILRSKQKISPVFFYAYFRSYEFINNKLRPAVEGIRDGKSINMDTFWNLTIPFPPIKKQDFCAVIFNQIDNIIEVYEKLLRCLADTKQYLLQQMFI